MTDARIPVLLDTDIGSDIDDAVCLGYLLRQPRCELLGITTVSGQPRLRAAMADAVCQAAGRREVAIHSGHDLSLVNREAIQPEVPHAAILQRFPHRAPESFPERTAVEFLRQQIRSRPGEITLLAIGPMTNLGLLFSLDPDCAKLLKRLVLMCGVFHAPPPGWGHAEWNARLDPHATSIVYQAPVADHVSIGLDVTLRCLYPSSNSIAAFKEAGGPLDVVSAATEVWAKHSHRVVFHDPLAGAVAFNPGLCTLRRGKVTVELASPRSSGITYFDHAENGPHQVALEVQPEAFFKDYFSVVGATTVAAAPLPAVVA
jgi:purine nucleosidase